MMLAMLEVVVMMLNVGGGGDGVGDDVGGDDGGGDDVGNVGDDPQTMHPSPNSDSAPLHK